MPTVRLDDREIQVQAEESLLDALLREGVAAPHGCRQGACQTCRVRVAEGEIAEIWQPGLSTSDREQGWVLACRTYPAKPLSISWSESQRRFDAVCIANDQLAEDVFRLRLSRPTEFHYRPGQFTPLVRGDGREARSYSLAGLPGDEYIEYHIRRVPGGAVSPWLCEDLKIGATLEIGEARGDCILDPADDQRPLVMVAIGTGLAPILGLAREALSRPRELPIHFYVAGRTAERLYGVDDLRALSDANALLDLRFVVLEGSAPGPNGRTGDLAQVLREDFPSLSGHGVLLAGDPAMVEGLKKNAFLAGADLDAIRADAFLPSP